MLDNAPNAPTIDSMTQYPARTGFAREGAGSRLGRGIQRNAPDGNAQIVLQFFFRRRVAAPMGHYKAAVDFRLRAVPRKKNEDLSCVVMRIAIWWQYECNSVCMGQDKSHGESTQAWRVF